MDRNFILAIALFYIVLVTYQSVFTPPKHAQQEKTTQAVENNKDTSKQVTVLASSAKITQVTTKQDFKEEITSIKTTNTLFEFSRKMPCCILISSVFSTI